MFYSWFYWQLVAMRSKYDGLKYIAEYSYPTSLVYNYIRNHDLEWKLVWN